MNHRNRARTVNILALALRSVVQLLALRSHQQRFHLPRRCLCQRRTRCPLHVQLRLHRQCHRQCRRQCRRHCLRRFRHRCQRRCHRRVRYPFRLHCRRRCQRQCRRRCHPLIRRRARRQSRHWIQPFNRRRSPLRFRRLHLRPRRLLALRQRRQSHSIAQLESQMRAIPGFRRRSSGVVITRGLRVGTALTYRHSE